MSQWAATTFRPLEGNQATDRWWKPYEDMSGFDTWGVPTKPKQKVVQFVTKTTAWHPWTVTHRYLLYFCEAFAVELASYIGIIS